MKILFVYQSMMSFVDRDLDILRQVHEVRPLKFTGKKGFFKRIIPDIISLWHGLLWCDITFSWFGKLHAFFAILFGKILGKKAIVVSGGDDVAKLSEIKYGLFTQPLKMWCPLFVFRFADIIFCVSEGNREETIVNAKANLQKIRLIYHGFDLSPFRRIPEIQKEPLVITVGRITKETIVKKGLKFFVQTAAFLPNIMFAVVGPDEDGTSRFLKSIAPPNVIFTGGVYGDALVELYNRAAVYVQLSYAESFGCSIAEAMLCECVPVLSRRRSLPEVGGNCAIYCDELNPRKVASCIQEALKSHLGPKARERIMTSFPFEKRRDGILAAVAELDSSRV